MTLPPQYTLQSVRERSVSNVVEQSRTYPDRLLFRAQRRAVMTLF